MVLVAWSTRANCGSTRAVTHQSLECTSNDGSGLHAATKGAQEQHAPHRLLRCWRLPACLHVCPPHLAESVLEGIIILGYKRLGGGHLVSSLLSERILVYLKQPRLALHRWVPCERVVVAAGIWCGGRRGDCRGRVGRRVCCVHLVTSLAACACACVRSLSVVTLGSVRLGNDGVGPRRLRVPKRCTFDQF
jgi:hypothetical protein